MFQQYVSAMKKEINPNPALTVRCPTCGAPYDPTTKLAREEMWIVLQ
jgi:biotin synthase-related radical SAM superfamily protein